MVVVVAMMMTIKIMIINNFLNVDERHEDGWKLLASFKNLLEASQFCRHL